MQAQRKENDSSWWRDLSCNSMEYIEKNKWFGNANRSNSVNNVIWPRNLLRNSIIHFHICSYIWQHICSGSRFQRCDGHKLKIFLSIKFVKKNKIFWTCYRHSFETMNLSKYVAEYEQMWKWIIEFLSKFQGRDLKIAELIRYVLPNHWFSSKSDIIMSCHFLCVELYLVYIPWNCECCARCIPTLIIVSSVCCPLLIADHPLEVNVYNIPICKMFSARPSLRVAWPFLNCDWHRNAKRFLKVSRTRCYSYEQRCALNSHLHPIDASFNITVGRVL